HRSAKQGVRTCPSGQRSGTNSGDVFGIRRLQACSGSEAVMKIGVRHLVPVTLISDHMRSTMGFGSPGSRGTFVSPIFHRLFAICLRMPLPQLAYAERYALLIGAAHFPNAPKIPSLDGPVNDVEALRAELLRSWKIAPDKITVLVEQAASRNAILSALDTMVA